MSNHNLKENKFKRFLGVCFRDIIKFFSKIQYVKLQYRYITHHKLNLTNPTRYTEKLQYLRLFTYPKNPLVVQAASRVGLRKYVTSLGLESHLIELYGIYDHFDEIDFNSLPDAFVMKCSHASGFNYICWSKDKINYSQLKKQFTKWLKTNYGKKTIEMHYSSIKPQIVIEKLLLQDQQLPIEYKIHVFNGKAKYLYIVTGRGADIRYTNLYIDFSPFDKAQFNGWKTAKQKPKQPLVFNQMITLAETLAKPFPFVRVDLFCIENKIYINELTFTPAKGTLIFDDDQADFEIGKWLLINTNEK